MKTTTESRLRTVALVLTAIVLLQLVWSGVSLLLTADPEPTAPAEGSLHVDEIRHSAPLSGELSESLAARPVFWQGREKFVPAQVVQGDRKRDRAPRNSNIDDVALQGTYTAGDKSGVIIAYKDERRRLQRDEEVAGWTFTLLSEEGATFESGRETKVLALEHAKSDPAAKRQREPEPAPEIAEQKDESNKQDETGE
jgi:hypothetical protein